MAASKLPPSCEKAKTRTRGGRNEQRPTQPADAGNCPDRKRCKYTSPHCLSISLGVSEIFSQNHLSTF